MPVSIYKRKEGGFQFLFLYLENYPNPREEQSDLRETDQWWIQNCSGGGGHPTI